MRAFDGKTEHCGAWRLRLKDHLMLKEGRLGEALKSFESRRDVITNDEQLSASTKFGTKSMWDVSRDMYCFMGLYMNDDMFRMREQLAGEGNGFELWRRLCHDQEGGDELVETAGIQRFFQQRTLQRLQEAGSVA